MKKYLKITGYVMLYLVIFVIILYVITRVWVSGSIVSKEFAFGNLTFANLVAFILILGVLALIFKMRKKPFIKTLNIAPLKTKNWMVASGIGIMMGTFTCLVCNTSMIRSITVFERYLKAMIDDKSYFALFLIVVAITFSLEEMIFRGVVFNEILSGVSLYKAIFLSSAVYGLLNALTISMGVGVYSTIAALAFTFGYVYSRSLIAPMMMQITSIYVIAAVRKTGLWKPIADLGDVVLIILVLVNVLCMAYLYLAMYKEYKKTMATKKPQHAI